MKRKIAKVGIMSRQDYISRTINIAKGMSKRKGEPKIWFESFQSMAQVLSEENRDMLDAIIERRPASILELEEITGRKSSNISRTLKTLARFGIVTLEKEHKNVRPVVNYTDFHIEVSLSGHGA